VPVCGGGDEKQAAKLVKIPIWAFHGAKDKVVKVSRSRNMIEAIKSAGGRPKYTEYKTVFHNSWDSAYNEPDLLPWLFSQSKLNQQTK
jgi:predicted peptidase